MWFHGQKKNIEWFLTARYYLVNYGSFITARETILSFMTISYMLNYISFFIRWLRQQKVHNGAKVFRSKINL